MFPIPWNFPFKKKDGTLTTVDDAISAGGGGGGGYTLPTASAVTKGGVKIGSGLSMSGEVLNNPNPTPYVLPIASDETLGGVIVGSGLSINDGVLSNNNPNPTEYTPTLAASVSGFLKLYKHSDNIIEIIGELTLSSALTTTVTIVNNLDVDYGVFNDPTDTNARYHRICFTAGGIDDSGLPHIVPVYIMGNGDINVYVPTDGNQNVYGVSIHATFKKHVSIDVTEFPY